MIEFKQIRLFGIHAVLIEWEPKIDPEILQSIRLLDHHLNLLQIPGFVESVPAYASLTVFFNPSQISYHVLVNKIYDIQSEALIHSLPLSTSYTLPVCYETKYALDMQLCESLTGLSMNVIIQLHTEAEYLVYFIGFLPGFMYLGGLDDRLYMPRKQTPRMEIPQGSVGIAGTQTGVYPKNSPAGWQIIGRCPMLLFDPYSKQPCTVQSGDTIRFKAITEEDFINIL